MHDSFANHKLRYELVDRGYLTEEEVLRIMKKHFDIERLELVKNIFIFSCFTGLAYIDVYNLTYDKIVTVEDRQWLITKRYKTSVDENVMLLDIPLAIIRKYYDINRKGGKVFPMLSNQRINSYLKEIADLCGIKKNLTFHMAKHRDFHKHQIINRLNCLPMKVGNDKETSELLYSTLFCHFKEPLCLLQR